MSPDFRVRGPIKAYTILNRSGVGCTQDVGQVYFLPGRCRTPIDAVKRTKRISRSFLAPTVAQTSVARPSLQLASMFTTKFTDAVSELTAIQYSHVWPANRQRGWATRQREPAGYWQEKPVTQRLCSWIDERRCSALHQGGREFSKPARREKKQGARISDPRP